MTGRRLGLLSGAAVALLTSCGSAGPSTDPSAGGPRYSMSHVGVEHVHALGVDPRDGVLYAATHYGLFRLPAGQPAQRVADRFQDTMGFTITSEGTFLGSGHPDLAKDPDLPVRLGLIRSNDRAQTWQPVSLGGQADFHVLRSSPAQLVGWDATSSELMVSLDQGRTWQLRSRLDLRDLVVDPANPDVMLATTARGLVRSSDGGRTFASLPAAGVQGVPAVLSWTSTARLTTIDQRGSLSTSADGGRTWSVRGSLGGSPQALLDAAGTLFAAREGAILSSEDGGRSWKPVYQDPAP